MTVLKTPLKRTTPIPLRHGIRPQIVVALYPAHGAHGPRIGLREGGRRANSEVTVEVGALYARLTTEAALERARKRKAHRKHREPVEGCEWCERRTR